LGLLEEVLGVIMPEIGESREVLAGLVERVTFQIPTIRGMQSFCPAHIAFCWRPTGKLRLHHISANETCNLR
jgi:hypothetical protein